jgi:hypothetical protein
MSAHDHPRHEHGGPGYASPQVAREQPPEQFVYVAALYEGTGIDRRWSTSIRARRATARSCAAPGAEHR